MIENIEKGPLKSKKFLALTMLVVMTTGLITAAILMRISPEVLQSMVTILGGGTAASVGGLIGAQGYVDGRVRPLLIEAEAVIDEEVITKPEET